MATSSDATKKPSNERKESNAVCGQKRRNQSVGAAMVFNPTPTKQQRRGSKPKRQFTEMNMPLSQVLQHLLKKNLITLREPHPNTNTSSPSYNPNARCAFHSNSPGHDTDSCWALKHQIQDLIDAKVIEFGPP